MPDKLSGDLASLRVIDILRVLHQNARTGRLALTHSAESGDIYFDQGEVVQATYRDQKGEEVVYWLLSWSRGGFLFKPDDAHAEKAINTPTRDILARGDAVDKEWESIRDVVSSGETVFAPTPAILSEFRLADLEVEVLQEVNGRHTVRDVAGRLGRSELDVSRALRKLFLLGLVEADRRAGGSSDATVDRSVFEIIQAELTKVIGPIAPVILDEQIERMGSSRHYFPKSRLAELAEWLSREIPSEVKQVRFQQTMVQLLKKV